MNKKLWTAVGAFMLTCTLATSVGHAATLDKQYPTEDEIVDYLKAHPLNTSRGQSYKVKSTDTVVGQTRNTYALNTANFVRFLAGSNSVKQDSRYSDLAQHASYILRVNDDEETSHHPYTPSGFKDSDEVVLKGKTGAANSNLGYGYSNIQQSILYGYMYDSDRYNAETVGHRIYMINPVTRAMGFGKSGRYTATLISDSKSSFSKSAGGKFYTWTSKEIKENTAIGNEAAPDDISIWPTTNMPKQYFDASVPYSFTVGENYNLYEATVTMKNERTGKKITLEKGGKISEGPYMRIKYQDTLASVIWRPDPKDFPVEVGDTYTITINHIKKENSNISSITYKVTFFDLQKKLPEFTLPSSITLKEGESMTLDTTKQYDYTVLKKDDVKLSATSKNGMVIDTNKQTITAQHAGTGELQLSVSTPMTTFMYYHDSMKLTTPIKVIANPAWMKSIKAPKKVTLQKGKSYQLKPTVLPKTSKEKTFTYKSTAPKVATVSTSGKIVAYQKGKTTVTITGLHGISKKVQVVVK